MDADEQRKTQEWVETKWNHGPCPVCQTNSYSAGDDLTEIRSFSGGDLVIGSAGVYPLFPVTCNNCGYTLLINALVAGIVSLSDNAPSGEAVASDAPDESEGEK